MLGVVAGHVIGLLVPKAWTDAVGISEEAYHLVALVGGIIAGLATLVGLVILIYRRRTVGPVFSATTPMDKVMYAFLGTVIVLGIWNTIGANMLGIGAGPGFNYRDNVSLWFRGIFSGNPDPAYMTGVPLGFQLHALVATLLFALSVLLHAWVGMRDIFMDYVHHTGLRLALYLAVIVTLVGSVAWLAATLGSTT